MAPGQAIPPRLSTLVLYYNSNKIAPCLKLICRGIAAREYFLAAIFYARDDASTVKSYLVTNLIDSQRLSAANSLINLLYNVAHIRVIVHQNLLGRHPYSYLWYPERFSNTVVNSIL